MGRRLRFLPYDRTLVEVTNRTIHGRHLLRPTKRFRAIVLGALGRAQRLYGVDIHALVFLSNHYHLLITVRDGDQMAAFMAYFQSKLAREIARLTGWREKIWGRRYAAIVVSEEETAQIDRLDYILSNGVKEGLVVDPADWPGAHSVHALLEGAPLEGLRYDRTAEYAARKRGEPFRQDQFAESETVEITPLPCWRSKSSEWIRNQVRQMVGAIVAKARSHEGRSTRLLPRSNSTARPRRLKRSPAPWFHCASRQVHRELRRAYGEFLAAYRDAANCWRRGEFTAPFPERCFPPPHPYLAGT